MQRYGTVLSLREDKIERYKELHAAVWPDVLAMIRQVNIRNYSIYLRRFPDGHHYLVSYFEYHGSDFAGDMAKMAADPETLRWWDVCKPLLDPFADRGPDDYWAGMEEVFHYD